MLRLSEEHLELGKLLPNTIHTFNVVVFNDGDIDITPSLSVSCGCTVPTLEPHSIPAKGQSELIGAFDTTGKKGHQHKRIYVTYTLDSKTFSITLDFKAEII